MRVSTFARAYLERYSRPVVHLRQQVSAGRFGLMFGAGLSKSFCIPTWETLVHLLAKDPDVKGEGVLRMVPPRVALPYRTEMLFEHYKQRGYQHAESHEHHTRELDYAISADWRKIVRRHLYAQVTDGIEDSLPNHPYLPAYLPLIQQSHMTVTYNFDDFMEQALFHKKADKDTRGFETVTNLWTQFRRTNSIIYHPHGVIPQNRLEVPSDRFVFSEASYAEELMGIYAGEQAGLVNHLSKHTVLCIGLSLEDDILRSILMQGARVGPGNFHYYVHFLKDSEILEDQQQRAIKLANFKVYNLITLFLRKDEIRVLGEMLNPATCPGGELCDFARVHRIDMRFRFYVTGALGVGKSKAINHFRNLVVYDEWLDERPLVLAEDWEDLSDDGKAEADAWILDQFEKKNAKLRRAPEGIFMLDRGPLDPLAFTPVEALARKASLLLDTLCPNRKWEVEDGRVILLQGDPRELALRMVISQRPYYTSEKLSKMDCRLSESYGTDGVVRVDTRGLNPTDVAARVAEIVHLEKYKPTCNVHERLEKIQKQ